MDLTGNRALGEVEPALLASVAPNLEVLYLSYQTFTAVQVLPAQSAPPALLLLLLLHLLLLHLPCSYFCSCTCSCFSSCYCT